MVAIRKAIETTYIGSCDITQQFKINNPDKTTGFEKKTIFKNQPCKLSFKKIVSANQGDVATSVTQGAKVFISPDITISPGSQFTITQNGVTTDYKSSGEPAIYSTHQEIELELFKGWT